LQQRVKRLMMDFKVFHNHHWVFSGADPFWAAVLAAQGLGLDGP
jgi:uncharacterized membrane protein